MELAREIEKNEPHNYFYNMFSRYTSSLDLKTLRRYWEKYLSYYYSYDINIPVDMYVHIPFCTSKCSYCQYFSVSQISDRKVSDYLNYLKDYILYFSDVFNKTKIKNLYVGGGTPNYLSPSQLDDLLTCIFENMSFEEGNYERTIELHPAQFDKKYLSIAEKFDFNRISLGIQSFNNMTLKSVNRTYVSFQDAKDICSTIRSSSRIKYLNIDLIVGLKGEDENDILDSINKTVKLGADTITLYTIQEHVTESSMFTGHDSFYKRVAKFFLKIKKEQFDDYIFSTMGDSLIIGGALIRKDFSHMPQRYEKESSEKKSVFAIGGGSKGHIYGLLEYKHMDSIITNFSETQRILGQRFTWDDFMANYMVRSFYEGKIDKHDFNTRFKSDIHSVFSEEISFLKEEGVLVEGDGIYYWRLDNPHAKILYSSIFIPSSFLKKIIRSQKKSS